MTATCRIVPIQFFFIIIFVFKQTAWKTMSMKEKGMKQKIPHLNIEIILERKGALKCRN